MTRTLWFAVFAGHLAWSAHLLIGYFMASLTCGSAGTGPAVPLHVATVSALAVTTAGIAAGRAAASQPALEHRFVGYFGITLGAIFLFAIALAGAVAVFVSPCV